MLICSGVGSRVVGKTNRTQGKVGKVLAVRHTSRQREYDVWWTCGTEETVSARTITISVDRNLLLQPNEASTAEPDSYSASLSADDDDDDDTGSSVERDDDRMIQAFLAYRHEGTNGVQIDSSVVDFNIFLSQLACQLIFNEYPSARITYHNPEGAAFENEITYTHSIEPFINLPQYAVARSKQHRAQRSCNKCMKKSSYYCAQCSTPAIGLIFWYLRPKSRAQLLRQASRFNLKCELVTST
ncbi:hypothetical protein P3T76_008297 [Phytophthora citrophthora]|uniref:Uncharacterized protein n=1 Tax=Phytophthora citrophthora TaxID=4793 RepID=A0AAD9GJX7_9STRA|nr:hypothetical protein P3T76_008297 [Phytophthora citrophthora]